VRVLIFGFVLIHTFSSQVGNRLTTKILKRYEGIYISGESPCFPKN
jgi:hypothetical protein